MTTSNLPARAAELIDLLELQPHPEGGYFRETVRSGSEVTRKDGSIRSASTAIYFLLVSGTFSRWHRVASDEVWHHYEGGPIELFLVNPDFSEVKRERVGPLHAGARPHVLVPAGWWQAARPVEEFGMAGCTVAPGFEFEDFAFMDESDDRIRLRNLAPDLTDLL